VKLQLTALQKMTEFGLVWTATLDGPESVGRTSAFLTDLLFDDTREATLLELSKKREQVPELALILWHSFGMCRIRL
jgi:hypothetical protein